MGGRLARKVHGVLNQVFAFRLEAPYDRNNFPDIGSAREPRPSPHWTGTEDDAGMLLHAEPFLQQGLYQMGAALSGACSPGVETLQHLRVQAKGKVFRCGHCFIILVLHVLQPTMRAIWRHDMASLTTEQQALKAVARGARLVQGQAEALLQVEAPACRPSCRDYSGRSKSRQTGSDQPPVERCRYSG